MIISIAGSAGCGKTSTARSLAGRLGYTYYSVGGLRGRIAQEMGLTIDGLNALGEQDPSTDRIADEYQRELGRKEDNFVIEGRLAWHFIPHSFKVYLTCDVDEAARRVFFARKQETDRSDEPLYKDLGEAKRVLTERTASDVRRYEKHYGLNYQDPAHYDLVLDTTDNKSPEETVEAILKQLKESKGIV
jgi:CMP/dCMP kinase